MLSGWVGDGWVGDGWVMGGWVMGGWDHHLEADGVTEASVFSASLLCGLLGPLAIPYKISKCPSVSGVGGFALKEHVLNFLDWRCGSQPLKWSLPF